MQFEKAEYHPGSGKTCALCQKGIADNYYHLSGQVICPECAGQVEKHQASPGPALVLRGALFALAAAAVCSAVYATILIVAKFELALIAIAVGWVIGTAARRGTNGLGGRNVQYVAVAATYIAICGSLFFQIVWEAIQQGKSFTAVGYVVMAGVSLGKPFFELSEGFGGIIGLVILFFGMQQAWKQTGNLEGLALMGPYQVEPERPQAV